MNDFDSSVLVIVEQFFLPQDFIYHFLYKDLGIDQDALLGLAALTLTAAIAGMGMDISKKSNIQAVSKSPFTIIVFTCGLFIACGLNAPLILLIIFVILKMIFSIGVIRIGIWAIAKPQWFALAIAVSFTTSYLLTLFGLTNSFMSIVVIGWSSTEVMIMLIKDFKYQGVFGLVPLFLIVTMSNVIPVRNLDLGLTSLEVWYATVWDSLASLVDIASRLSFPISFCIGVGTGIYKRTA